MHVCICSTYVESVTQHDLLNYACMLRKFCHAVGPLLTWESVCNLLDQLDILKVANNHFLKQKIRSKEATF